MVGEPLQPLSRRLLQVAAALSLLLIAVVANALLHTEGNPLNPIAEAAMRTERAPGARMAIVAIYSSPASSRTVTATGSGAYNATTGRSRFRLDIPTGLGTERIVGVGDERMIYTHSTRIAEGLPPGKRWLGVAPWLGHAQSEALAGRGTRAELEMLRAVSDGVESLGSEQVRGTSTQRYRGTISFRRYAALLRGEGKAELASEYESVAKLMSAPVSVEVWIDEHGLVRSERTTMTLPSGAGGAPITMDMRTDLFDFGARPKVSLPPAGEVFDTTPIMRAELHLLNGPSASRFIAPAGPVLSVGRFRAKARAICRGMGERARPLVHASAPQMRRFQAAVAEVKAGESGIQPMIDAYRAVAERLYEPAMRIASRALRRLGRLNPPSSLAGRFHSFLRVSTVSGERLLAGMREIEAGEPRSGAALSKQNHATARQADRLAGQLGLGACANHQGSSGNGASA